MRPILTAVLVLCIAGLAWADMTITSHATNVTSMLADDTTVYSVTLVVQHTDGVGAIASMRTKLHNESAYDELTPENGRGYLAWGQTDADIYHFEGTADPWTLMGSASGGGVWGYMTNDWGGTTYITPVGCSTSTSGNERTVTFTFTVKSTWSASSQALVGFAHDTSLVTEGWTRANWLNDFRVRPDYNVIPDRCIGPKDNTVAVNTYSIPSIAAADIVWCDDFNSYCLFNQGNDLRWPGYPPDPDNICGEGDMPYTPWFQNAVHWPRMITNGRRSEVHEHDWVGWDSQGGWITAPYVTIYPGYTSGDTTQYNSFDMTAAIAEHFADPEADLVFGTDDNPLFLRYWMYHRHESALNGQPWYSPHYVEIRMDTGLDDPTDWATTDYVEQDCLGYHDCNCLDANAAAGVYCQLDPDPGSCEGTSCVTWPCNDPQGEFICIGGPNDGQACDPFTPGDCGQTCADPPYDPCTSDGDCYACAGGTYAGSPCDSDADCRTNACVGGAVEGQDCSTDDQCQRVCLTGQSTTCEGGPQDGTACTEDAECAGGPVYPIVNQQWLSGQIAAPSPPLDTQKVWKSLAWGMLAQTCRNPCEGPPGGLGKPHHYRPNTFDGNRWWDLRANVKPAVLYGGDFNYSSGQAYFEMEIRTNTYIVRLLAPAAAGVAPIWNDAVLERKYLGPFNTVSMGTGPGRKWEYNDTTLEWELVGEPDLWRYPQAYPQGQWCHAWIDRPTVLGGEVGSTAGACCLPDLSCIETDDATCAAQDGQFEGYGTLCSETLCCRYPFADADGDGDVDQADFGIWQSCYTGAGGGILPDYCECFDRVNDVSAPEPDGDVDAFDFVEFMNCYTGANVQYDDVINLINCKP